MKKVLFIAYYFPPMGGSGVQRSLKFVKYLHKYDVETTVLTVNPFFTRWPKDTSIVSEIPTDVIVYRTPTLDLNWLFKLMWGFRLNKLVSWIQMNILIPDPEITWLPFAKSKLKQIMKKQKHDLAYISGGPYSTMLLGLYLKDRYNTDYIVDFRDEWTNSHIRLDNAKCDKARRRDNLLEEEVLRKSCGIIYAHPSGMQKNFESKYPFLKAKPFRVITNGFDESDFQMIDPGVVVDTKILEIVYSGSFYDRRRPEILFRAILNLIKNGQINPKLIQLRIIGKNTPAFVLGEFKDNLIINNIVRFQSYLSHKQVLEAVCKSSVLLLYLSPGPNSEPEIPGKLFEYLRSFKPLLAIVPPNGAVAKIVRRCKAGYVFDSASEKQVMDGLLKIYHAWLKGELHTEPDTEYIKQFKRENLTKKLVSLINEVTQSTSPETSVNL